MWKARRLLAADESKPGTLGWLFHKTSKWFIRAAVDKLHSHMKPVIDYQEKVGFINPEIQVLYDDLTEICKRHEGIAWTKEGDINRKLFYQMRDILCTTLDQDTYYFLRFLYFMELSFKHKKKYRIHCHKSRAYWNYEQFKIMLNQIKAEDKHGRNSIHKIADADAG